MNTQPKQEEVTVIGQQEAPAGNIEISAEAESGSVTVADKRHEQKQPEPQPSGKSSTKTDEQGDRRVAIDKREKEMFQGLKSIEKKFKYLETKRNKIQKRIESYENIKNNTQQKLEDLEVKIKTLRDKIPEVLEKGKSAAEINREVRDTRFERDGFHELLDEINKNYLPSLKEDLNEANRILWEAARIEVSKFRTQIQDELNQVLTDVVSRDIHAYRQAVRKFEIELGIRATSIPIMLKYERVITGHMRPPI